MSEIKALAVVYKYKCLMCASEHILPEPPGSCKVCGGQLVKFNYWYERKSNEREEERITPENEEEEENEDEDS